MLVLTRRINESISIGSDISIKVISVSGRQVRLGIEARPETPVFRSEIFEMIKKSVREANQTQMENLEKALSFFHAKGFFQRDPSPNLNLS